MAGLLEYKCPCCGGAIEFDSASQQMKCPYCDTVFDVETLKSYDAELKKEKHEEVQWSRPEGNEWQTSETDGMLVYTCTSCGGEIIADQNTAATSCPFCGNPVIMSRQFAGDLRPDYVIPFKLDKAAAKAAFAQHLKGKRLLPKLFKEQNHIEEIKGIYVPFWLFDADVQADLRYRATRIRTWRDSRYNYTETSYFSVTRAGDVQFSRVPVDGSSKMADDLMESLEPFDFSQAVDFQTAYLAGYLADRYDVSANDCVSRANSRIRRSTEEVFSSTVKGFATVVPEGGGVQVQNGTTKYALYPVWLLTTVWKGKPYLFAMNGQTGKLVGDLPVDKGAYWRWFGGLAAAFSAAAFAVCWLIGMM